MKKLSVVLLFFIITLTANAQDSSMSSQRLVWMNLARDAETPIVSSADINGNLMAFGGDIPFTLRSCISPDGKHIAFLTLENQLYITNTIGEILNIVDVEENSWLRNWSDNHTLNFYSNSDGVPVHYRINVDAPIPRPELNEALNRSLIWNYGELDGLFRPPFSTLSFIYFSNDNQYVGSHLPHDLSVDDSFAMNELYIWQNRSEAFEEVKVLENTPRWWQSDSWTIPTWANQHPWLAIGIVEQRENSYRTSDLYYYDVQNDTLNLISDIQCPPNIGYCYPEWMKWSPSDSQIAFWQATVYQGEENGGYNSKLVIYDLETNNSRVVYETGYAPMVLYWSPDGQYLAFREQGKGGRLIIIDVATEIWFEVEGISNPIHIVGWVDTELD